MDSEDGVFIKDLYRLRNRKGEFYSPGSWPKYRRWNGTGKWITKQQLSQVLPYIDKREREGMVAERWHAAYTGEEPV